MVAVLPSARLLEAREIGARLHPLDRALAVLRLAHPDAARDPAEWPLAERDTHLLALRRATFGDNIACLADCPRCGETHEFSLSASALIESLGPVPAPETISAQGWQLTLRALDSRDLAAATRAADAGEAARALLRRAIAVTRSPGSGDGAARIDARPGARNESVTDVITCDLADALPDVLLQQAEQRIAEREAAADVAIDLQCSACATRWTEAFDIGAHLWTELDAAAQRLLREVVVLAQCFGWSEADILAMSAARRQSYLQAAGLLS